MQRGQLFRTPVTHQVRLSYTREFLDWAYTAGRSPEWLQGAFWDWFLGVSHEQARGQIRKHTQSIMRDTASWNWPRIQTAVREGLEDNLTLQDQRRVRLTVQVPRRLSTWEGPDGRRYLQYGPVLPLPLTQDAIIGVALDEALSELRGLAVEVLGTCRQCGRYFVRLRSARKQFCSARCTWQAYPARGKRPRAARRIRSRVGGKR